ncbi:MAG TPA: endonuclease V [Desulfurococcales archaeon]|nr:endonuclease V [Desulfurococcales archaeon]
MIDLNRAKHVQELLARMVVLNDIFTYPPKFIGGLDISYRRSLACAVCIIMEYPSLKLVRKKVYIDEVRVPYIPTFLAFRELPFYITLCYEFKKRRDIVFLVDGHGLSHPRMFGIASHLGVVLDIPTIGVAKKKLAGTSRIVNGVEYITINNLAVCMKLQHNKLHKPLYVSIGHGVSLKTAVEIVKNTLKSGHLPEPIRIADKISRDIIKRRRIT